MTTLREKVAEAMQDFDEDAMEHGAYPIQYYRQISDAAIATVFDALRSDTAVMAGAQSLYRASPVMILSGPRPSFYELSESHQDEYRRRYCHALKDSKSALTTDDAQTGEEDNSNE